MMTNCKSLNEKYAGALAVPAEEIILYLLNVINPEAPKTNVVRRNECVLLITSVIKRDEHEYGIVFYQGVVWYCFLSSSYERFKILSQ